MALLIIIVAIIDQPWTLAMPGPSTIWALVALGVLGTALAYIVFFEILVRAGASNVMLVTLLIPVTAIGFSYLFFDEVVRPKEIVGALIIGAGLLLIDGRVLGFFRTSRR
ncbi:MAG: DMT family transporter [Pseudomonadota bacterium]